mgnify:CR=1 FL=1
MLIETYFLPCTENRPSRIKARKGTQSVVLAWDHALEPFGNHRRAFEAMKESGQFAFTWGKDGVGLWVSTDRIYEV